MNLLRFPTNENNEETQADLYLYEETQKEMFKEKYPEVDTPEKFQLASIKCCNTMRTMFQHHDDILNWLTTQTMMFVMLGRLSSGWPTRL